MNQHCLAIVISLTIHLTIFGIISSGILSHEEINPLTVVDLSLVESSPGKKSDNHIEKTLKNEMTIKKKETVVKEITSDDIVYKNVPDTITDSIAEDKKYDNVNNNTAIIEQKAISDALETKSVQNDSVNRQILEKQYLNEQFMYIAKIIQKHTKYPALAEEMGITGTVCLQFIVNNDGIVGEVEIIKSSGSELLDRDAVKTVISAAPFPRPPIRVRVKFPLQYSIVN